MVGARQTPQTSSAVSSFVLFFFFLGGWGFKLLLYHSPGAHYSDPCCVAFNLKATQQPPESYFQTFKVAQSYFISTMRIVTLKPHSNLRVFYLTIVG